MHSSEKAEDQFRVRSYSLGSSDYTKSRMPNSTVQTVRHRMSSLKVRRSAHRYDNSEKLEAAMDNLTIQPTHYIDRSPLASPGIQKALFNDYYDYSNPTSPRSRQSSLRQHMPLCHTNSNPETKKRAHSLQGSTAMHHRRSQSCRRTQSTKRAYEQDLENRNNIRPRTLSMPSKNRPKRPQSLKCKPVSQQNEGQGQTQAQGQTPSQTSGEGTEQGSSPFYRVRSFTSTPRGIINRGDSFKRKRLGSSNSSIGSAGSCPERASRLRHTWSTQSQGSRGSSVSSSIDADDPPAAFRVLLLGAAGVGKTALIQQFTTSEYMGNVDPCQGKTLVIFK